MKTTTMTPKTSFLLIIILLFSCQKDEPEPNNDYEPPCYEENGLPCKTTTGENTFGCKINGEVWLPKGGFYYPDISGPVYYKNSGLFAARAYNSVDYSCAHNLDLEVIDLFSEGTYTSIPEENYLWACPDDFGTSLYIDTNEAAAIIITRLDPEEYIISGEFYMTVSKQDTSGSTIKKAVITDGRFDFGNVIVE